MDDTVRLQLEALKLLQQWSIWLITISTGFLALMSFAFKRSEDAGARRSGRLCIVFLLITVVLAVILVGAIPAIVQKLAPGIADNEVLGIGKARGIYGYLYLDLIPLWWIVSSQRITFLISLFFAARLLWIRTRNADGR